MVNVGSVNAKTFALITQHNRGTHYSTQVYSLSDPTAEDVVGEKQHLVGRMGTARTLCLMSVANNPNVHLVSHNESVHFYFISQSKFATICIYYAIFLYLCNLMYLELQQGF